SLLAAQVRQQEAALAIPAIQASKGDILTCPQDFVHEFASFIWPITPPKRQLTPHASLHSWLAFACPDSQRRAD
ncbi:hypothetical protein NDU88_000823, partial [Pleurodeles waltl]